jgi:DNA-binding CsgD family transcriptional regulator
MTDMNCTNEVPFRQPALAAGERWAEASAAASSAAPCWPSDGPEWRRGEPGLTGLFALIVDQVDQGLALLSSDTSVILINQAFRRACSRSQTLRLTSQHLVLANGQNGELRRAVELAVGGRRTLLEVHGEDTDRLQLAVMPLGRTAPGQTGSRPVLLVLGRQQLCEPVSRTLFCSNHHLTPAESTVLRLLADGMSPELIARTANVAVSTVRTQIVSIRQKTGAGSIGELLRLLAGLPQMPMSLTSA